MRTETRITAVSAIARGACGGKENPPVEQAQREPCQAANRGSPRALGDPASGVDLIARRQAVTAAKRQFDAAHAKGMRGLRSGDTQAFDKAIKDEAIAITKLAQSHCTHRHVAAAERKGPRIKSRAGRRISCGCDNRHYGASERPPMLLGATPAPADIPREIRRDDVSRAARSTRWRGIAFRSAQSGPEDSKNRSDCRLCHCEHRTVACLGAGRHDPLYVLTAKSKML